METKRFEDLPVGAVFFDYAYSGEWMKKLDKESARFPDGLIGLIRWDCPVQVQA
jgi:hypothetical protein